MNSKKAMVIGASGALGQAVTSALLGQLWKVVGVDVNSMNSPPAPISYTHIVIDAMASAENQQTMMLDAVSNGPPLNAIINVAGGWLGGSAADSTSSQAAELMIRQSLFSSLAAAHVFTQCGAKKGLLLLPGSAAALNPTPTMLGYGLAKAGVHHLTKSIAMDPSKLPEEACVIALLPTTLNTQSNRAAMSENDKNTWTSLSVTSKLITEWAEGVNRPLSGSLAILETTNDETKVIIQ